MKVYAIVGGIAAGKSSVARRLARRYGGVRLDADRIGHQVLRLGRVQRRLLATFGPDIVAPGGAIDRRRLGTLVFGKPARLRALDAIVHPEIAARIRARLGALRRRGVRCVWLDAALFYQFDLGTPVDGVLAVVAPQRVRRERLQARNGWTAREAAARLRSQPQVEAWARRADVRIDSDCSWRELDARLDAAWQELRRQKRRRGRGRVAV